jgi:hypothetical protein
MSSRVRTVSLCRLFIVGTKIMMDYTFSASVNITRNKPADKQGNASTLAIQVPE